MTVNMNKDYEDLYANLNSLLKDICTFLETKSLNLTTADKKKANTLIERSKKHLEIIEKFSTCNENSDCEIQEIAENSNENESERYVDMTKNTALPQKTVSVELPVYESKCPFQDLPAKDASQEIKYGTLTKRRKVLNIIDVSTKIHAVIHQNWLLLYNSSKDLKPDCALDLKQYKAKEDESDPNLTQNEVGKEGSLKKNTLNSKMTSSFKVFNSSPSQKKCYSFVASTHKDMLQWVVNINRRHDKAVLLTKYIHEEENYEICQDLQGAEGEENIYNEIEMPCRSAGSRPQSPNVEKYDPPAIPEKRPIVPKHKLSLPPTESRRVSYEELEKEPPLQNVSEKCSLSSFETSEEEDRTYYELDTITRDKENEKYVLKEPSLTHIKTDKIVSNNEDGTSSINGLSLQANQSPNRKNHLQSEVNELTTSENEHQVPNEDENTVNACLPEKTTQKPKIISPKPWKPFKKSISKNLRTPQISKNRPIRESLRSSPLKLENNPSLKESSCKRISPTKENSTTSSSDSSKGSNDSSKRNQGSSIVQIIRSKWSTNQSPPCSLETFSRNTKIETFQASPTKEIVSSDSSRSHIADIADSVRPMDSLLADVTRNGKNEYEKPMVLLKPSLEEEESSKKLKKSPVVPAKPKKAAKKVAL